MATTWFPRVKNLPSDDLLRTRALLSLASATYSTGDPVSAEPMVRETIEVLKTQLGAEQPPTLQATSFLEAICQRQGRYTESMTVALMKLERFDEAASLASEVLESYREVGERGIPARSAAWATLISTQRWQGTSSPSRRSLVKQSRLREYQDLRPSSCFSCVPR